MDYTPIINMDECLEREELAETIGRRRALERRREETKLNHWFLLDANHDPHHPSHETNEEMIRRWRRL